MGAYGIVGGGGPKLGSCGIVGVGKWGGGGQRLGMGWTDEGRVHGGGGEYRMLMGGDAGGGK